MDSACSLLAPRDSEIVGTRPGASGSASSDAGSGSATGGVLGAAGVFTAGGGEAGSQGGAAGDGAGLGTGNTPLDPVDVGTPSGDWFPANGLKTRWADEVSPSNPLSEYPRPSLTRRRWATLNGLWDYAINQAAAVAPSFGGDKILVPFALESSLSGVPAGLLTASDWLWYRRTFQLPADWRGERIVLHFGAVDWEASVRVNGVEVGTHRGGYDGFSFDITDQLLPSAQQEIVVRVFDPTDAGDQALGKQASKPVGGTSFTAVSGIWQSVWLEPVPALHIESVHFFTDFATGSVRVEPKLSGDAKGSTVRATVYQGSAELVQAESEDGASIQLTVPAAAPWSPTSPALYDVTIELEQGADVIVSADSYFGFRSLAVATAAPSPARIYLNGLPFLSVGVLEQGYWPDGLYTAPTDTALKSDLTLAKKLGFNSIRVHQKLEPERFYYWADRLGLMVWQDLPAAKNSTPEARTAFESEALAMVSSRTFHPSVGIWTLFSAGLGQAGFDTATLVGEARALIPGQLLIAASGFDDGGLGDVRDRPDSVAISAPVPDGRAVVLGQFGSLNRGISGHTWAGGGGSQQAVADSLRYQDLLRRVQGLALRPGLSGAVFRQLTDVEKELDGLTTYDRAVTKVSAQPLLAANTGQLSPIVPLLQASEFELRPAYVADAQIFRYTTDAPAPAPAWVMGAFDDSAWLSGPAGFGSTPLTPARVRTPLAFNTLWARTKFNLDAAPSGQVLMRLMYDEDTQVYLNGVLAADVSGFSPAYLELPVSEAARQALVAGENTVAVRCLNRSGDRYMDVGFWETPDPPALRVPQPPASPLPGLTYADYDITRTSLPNDFTTLGPARQTGTASVIGSYTPDLPLDNTRALQFHGFIDAPSDGIYTFYVDTDDGARLLIGTTLVAIRARGDGVTSRAGNIALAAGKHPIQIDYFANTDQGSPNVFAVSWAGPGIPMQAISADRLWH